MDGFDTIIYEKKDSKAYITLNRPKNLNVYNIQMRDDLFEVLCSVRDDNEIRAVIITGAGDKAFCAGADLTEFLTAPHPTAARRIRFERDVWNLFLSINKPIIAALFGYVLGSGIEIAICCDIRISSEDSQFGVPEMGLGIIPAAGGSQTLPRIVKRGQALEMLFSGRLVKAPEALKIGLVNKVVARKELIPFAEEMADKIASFNPKAVRTLKQAITRGLDLSVPEGLELEKRLAKTLLVTN